MESYITYASIENKVLTICTDQSLLILFLSYCSSHNLSVIFDRLLHFHLSTSNCLCLISKTIFLRCFLSSVLQISSSMTATLLSTHRQSQSQGIAITPVTYQSVLSSAATLNTDNHRLVRLLIIYQLQLVCLFI